MNNTLEVKITGDGFPADTFVELNETEDKKYTNDVVIPNNTTYVDKTYYLELFRNGNNTSNSKTITLAGMTFVEVSNITTTMPSSLNYSDLLTLVGTVVPANATNKTIIWSINDAGTTGASINGGKVSFTNPGTADIKATIANGKIEAGNLANYTKSFIITSEPDQPYVTFRSDTPMTITPVYTSSGIMQYSLDTTNWTNIGSAAPTASASTIYIRGTMSTNTLFALSQSSNKWVITGGTNVKVEGNLLTLINYNNPPTTLANYALAGLFTDCTSITNISSVKLTASVLSQFAYGSTFANTRITSLPSNLFSHVITTASYALNSAFYMCTSLTSVPSGFLPMVTITGVNCYQNMFQYCSNITRIPSDLLPAGTLPELSYSQMFRDCNNLVINKTSTTGYSRIFRVNAGSVGSNAIYRMFVNTSGDVKNTNEGTINANTNYYMID